MDKVEVTRADREASWLALNAGLMPVNGELAEFVNRWFDGREALEGPAAKTLDTIALAIATARAEGVELGRAEDRRDVVAHVMSLQSFDKTWIAKTIEAGEHIGAANAKDSP